MADEINVKAYGKVNLALDVVGKRPDGYHEVRMIMQAVGLCDDIVMKSVRDPGIRLTANVSSLSLKDDNLICRAAKMLTDEFEIKDGLDIKLVKRIPVAGGMAGGSSDAAAVLAGLNSMYGLGIDEKGLMERGAVLGADVPFCIMGGTALAKGVGDELTELKDMPDCCFLLAEMSESVSTGYVYESIDREEICKHPDIDGMAAAIDSGDLEGIAVRLGNVLEAVTEREHPIISRIKELMCRYGASGSLMSGSGPTVFGIFEDREKAGRAAEMMKRDLNESGVPVPEFQTAEPVKRGQRGAEKWRKRP